LATLASGTPWVAQHTGEQGVVMSVTTPTTRCSWLSCAVDVNEFITETQTAALTDGFTPWAMVSVPPLLVAANRAVDWHQQWTKLLEDTGDGSPAEFSLRLCAKNDLLQFRCAAGSDELLREQLPSLPVVPRAQSEPKPIWVNAKILQGYLGSLSASRCQLAGKTVGGGPALLRVKTKTSTLVLAGQRVPEYEAAAKGDE
jgi:hypothetical protein